MFGMAGGRPRNGMKVRVSWDRAEAKRGRGFIGAVEADAVFGPGRARSNR